MPSELVVGRLVHHPLDLLRRQAVVERGEGDLAAVGVPEMTPVAGSIESPAGNTVADQTNGAVPPVTVAWVAG